MSDRHPVTALVLAGLRELLMAHLWTTAACITTSAVPEHVVLSAHRTRACTAVKALPMATYEYQQSQVQS